MAPHGKQGRPRLIPGELIEITFTLGVSPSQYLVWKDAAEAADETMSQYARVALQQRYERENPHKLGFGEEFRMGATKTALKALAVILLWTGLASAQTVYNPKFVEFDSVDHATVDSYVLEYWIQGVDPTTGAPVTSGSIPKASVRTRPTGATPPFEATLADFTGMGATPVGQTYVARLKAVSLAAGESLRSPASNPFAFLAAPRSPAAVSIK